MLLPEACSVLEEGLEDTLTFYSYPRSHWRHIRSNNPLKRLFREVRRRTRVVGAFPDLTSCLMLACARLKWTEERLWGEKALHGHRSFTRGARTEMAGGENDRSISHGPVGRRPPGFSGYAGEDRPGV